MAATLFTPVTQLRPVSVMSQRDECFELSHTHKNSKPRSQAFLERGEQQREGELRPG